MEDKEFCYEKAVKAAMDNAFKGVNFLNCTHGQLCSFVMGVVNELLDCRDNGTVMFDEEDATDELKGIRWKMELEYIK